MNLVGGDESFNGKKYGKIKTVFRDEVVFDSDFDSGNLDNVVEIPRSDFDYEFNLWTAPDCSGTQFENSNRSWFYFGVRGGNVGGKMLLTIMNMNIQMKLYQQGMTVVFKQRGGWERMKERPSYELGDWGMKLSFIHTVPSTSTRLTTYYAFCYPHSYAECQRKLERIENNLSKNEYQNVYYHRELLTTSLEGRRVDLITISSTNGITQEVEPRLEGLFPSEEPRASIFKGKKVYVLSARVHPGEVPGSHIFNGFLDYLLNLEDLRSQKLRDKFVFKLVPMLNPDGVARGHYRTDTRGANLNRYYLEPNPSLHPSIFALKSVILHHHGRGELGEEGVSSRHTHRDISMVRFQLDTESDPPTTTTTSVPDPLTAQSASGIAVFVDLHGHAAKRGCFIYGNHFDDVTAQTENMLYPKLISLNSPHFDFGYCLFSEKNMYWKDKRDGMSKEGSGRVGIYKATGIIRSYTLECNYNTGRLCNSISPADPPGRATPPLTHHHNYPPKFTIPVFEEATLDLYECNPWSRVKKSQYGSLHGVRLALSEHISNSRACRELSSGSVSSGRHRHVDTRNRLTVRPGSGVSGHFMTSDTEEAGRTLHKPNNLTVTSRSSNIRTANGVQQSYIPASSPVTRQQDKARNAKKFLIGDISKSSLIIAKSKLSSLSVPGRTISTPSPHKGNPSTYKQIEIRTVTRREAADSDCLISEAAPVTNKGLVGRKDRAVQSRGAPIHSGNIEQLFSEYNTSDILSPPRATSLVIGLDLATLFPIDNCTPKTCPPTPSGYLSASPLKSRSTPNSYRSKRGDLIVNERRKFESNNISLEEIEGKEFVDKHFNSEEIRLVRRLPKSLQDRALKCLKEQKLIEERSKSENFEKVEQSTKYLDAKIENKNDVLYSAWTVETDKKKTSKIKSKPRKNGVSNLGCFQPTTTRVPRSNKVPTTQRTKKKTSSNKSLPQL